MPNQQQIDSAVEVANRRRSQRVLVRVPVLVRGLAEDDRPVSETTHTLVVNAHGALIDLAMDVRPGQKLVLEHGVSGKMVEARVVHVTKKETNKTEVGIAFALPAPYFWGIDFPPADWTQLPD
jgi:hypothetical protein